MGKERFVLSRFSKGKVTNLKDPDSFLKRYVLNPPLGFSGIAQQSLVMF